MHADGGLELEQLAFGRDGEQPWLGAKSEAVGALVAGGRVGRVWARGRAPRRRGAPSRCGGVAGRRVLWSARRSVGCLLRPGALPLPLLPLYLRPGHIVPFEREIVRDQGGDELGGRDGRRGAGGCRAQRVGVARQGEKGHLQGKG
eukprot:scaffold15633_cov107-Isochrysis_galbana.AAC.13